MPNALSFAISIAIASLFAVVARADDTSDAIEKLRVDRKIPAIGVIVHDKGEVKFREVFGTVAADSDERVTIDDAWHIGSDTKAMTATLAGRLVEAGKIQWTTTLGDACPELKDKVDAGWLDVTLEQWLTQVSGSPRSLENPALLGTMRTLDADQSLTPRERRSKTLETTYAAAPPRKAGEKFEYANLNFIVAGHMLESVSNRDWEDLVREEVFKPLNIESAGFGVPPRVMGHLEDGKPMRLDNPATLAPAGTVHLTLDDWLKFCRLHNGHGLEGFLSTATLQKLHTPALNNYAMGWIVVKRPDGNIILTHDGSNGFWYARAILRPDADRIVLIAMNKGDPQAADALTRLLTDRLFPPPSTQRH